MISLFLIHEKETLDELDEAKEKEDIRK